MIIVKISQWVEDELKNNREKEISKLKLKPSWKQRCFFETSLSLEYQGEFAKRAVAICHKDNTDYSTQQSKASTKFPDHVSFTLQNHWHYSSRYGQALGHAMHGVDVTVMTTPAIAAIFQTSIDRDSTRGGRAI
ncbi:hypothetical protein JHK86_029564 [Glycine max]|nr:hypothetical protein JHK86_029564 [Glycine max]